MSAGVAERSVRIGSSEKWFQCSVYPSMSELTRRRFRGRQLAPAFRVLRIEKHSDSGTFES
jgi:hypothetical protein